MMRIIITSNQFRDQKLKWVKPYNNFFLALSFCIYNTDTHTRIIVRLLRLLFIIIHNNNLNRARALLKQDKTTTNNKIPRKVFSVVYILIVQLNEINVDEDYAQQCDCGCVRQTLMVYDETHKSIEKSKSLYCTQVHIYLDVRQCKMEKYELFIYFNEQ